MLRFGIREWIAVGVLFAGFIADQTNDRATTAQLKEVTRANTQLTKDNATLISLLTARVSRIEETRYTTVDGARDQATTMERILETRAAVQENALSLAKTTVTLNAIDDKINRLIDKEDK